MRLYCGRNLRTGQRYFAFSFILVAIRLLLPDSFGFSVAVEAAYVLLFPTQSNLAIPCLGFVLFLKNEFIVSDFRIDVYVYVHMRWTGHGDK